MSLSSSVHVCQFINNYKMDTYPNVNDLSVSDIIDNYDDLITTVLEYPAVAFGELVFDKKNPEYIELSSNDFSEYTIDFQNFLKSFKSKGLSFLWNCFKTLKNTKNTMHVIYDLYKDTNEWLISVNLDRQVLINYTKSERHYHKLKGAIKELNKLHDEIDTSILLLFRAIKETFIKNDNVFNLCDILDEEAEFDDAKYLIPHVLNAIEYNSFNCFKKLYGQLLYLVEREMSTRYFNKICLLAHKHKSTAIKRTIARSLSSLGRKYREIYNKYNQIFDI